MNGDLRVWVLALLLFCAGAVRATEAPQRVVSLNLVPIPRAARCVVRRLRENL